MEFSNLFFLYIFLPLTLLVYFVVPQMRWKNYVLIAASLIFYAMGQPYFLPLLLLTAAGNYLLAFRVEDFEAAHRLHEEMGCICFENPAMGIYFITDPDGYWLEIVPAKR